MRCFFSGGIGLGYWDMILLFYSIDLTAVFNSRKKLYKDYGESIVIKRTKSFSFFFHNKLLMWKTAHWRNSAARQSRRGDGKKKKVVRSIIFLCTVFIVCFLPNGVATVTTKEGG